MMLIPCPVCGPRDEPEFFYAGEPVARPPSATDDRTWADYVFNRTNTKGASRELWCHRAGCGQWFTLARDTVSHAMLAQ